MTPQPYRRFTSTKLEEERETQDYETISLRLNREERSALEADKEILDVGGDSQIIKFLVDVGRNVVRSTFSERQLRYLVSRRRTGYDGRKRRSH